MATKILLGPVLSFRGVSQGKWQVSALIGIDEGDKAPKATLNKPSKFPARTRKTPFFGFCGLLRRPFGPFAGP